MPYDPPAMAKIPEDGGSDAGTLGNPSARAIVGLERLALAALVGCAVATGVALFAFPDAADAKRPEALRAAGTAIPFLGMILILAASRLRGTLLRAAQRQARLGPAPPDLVPAYLRAVAVDLFLLESVAWLGVAMVPTTGSVRYALVMIVAGVLGIAVRWPRRAELERLAR